MEIKKEDIKNTNLEPETFDIITCNPPYFEVKEKSKFNKNKYSTSNQIIFWVLS